MARVTFDQPALLDLGQQGAAARLQDALPAGLAAMQAATPVRTGALRASERATLTYGATGLGAALYADAPYAFWVNNGARGRPGVHFLEIGLDALVAAFRAGGGR